MWLQKQYFFNIKKWKHFPIYLSSITLYTLNVHNVMWQLHLHKTAAAAIPWAGCYHSKFATAGAWSHLPPATSVSLSILGAATLWQELHALRLVVELWWLNSLLHRMCGMSTGTIRHQGAGTQRWSAGLDSHAWYRCTACSFKMRVAQYWRWQKGENKTKQDLSTLWASTTGKPQKEGRCLWRHLPLSKTPVQILRAKVAVSETARMA